MTDEQTGLPADFVKFDGTRSTPTSPTNIGAYLWSAVAAERLGIIGHRETVARLTPHVGDARADGARATAASTSTGTTSAPATSRPCRRAATRSTPMLSSVDNGWLAVGLRVVASRVPELRTRAQALFDSMDFGFYYRRRAQPDPLPLRALDRRGGVLLRHDRLREPDRELRRDREGRAARRASTTARSARSTTTAISPRRSRSAYTRSYLGEPVFEGALPVRGDAGHAVVGRQHVRGADADAVRARGALGAGELGRQPPADRARADPPRADARRATATGASRPPTCPRAATTSTASTASA